VDNIGAEEAEEDAGNGEDESHEENRLSTPSVDTEATEHGANNDSYHSDQL
jgi:hypothetical protein